MALTLVIEQRLTNVGAVKFLDDNASTFSDAARNSLAFCRNTFPPGSAIRPDDVAQALAMTVAVNQSFKAFLSAKKLTQKYWISDFAHLIIDRVWIEINQP